MTRTERLRRSMLLFGAVALLLAVGAGVGSAGDAETTAGRSNAAVTAPGVIGSLTGGALDPRLQRDTKIENGQRLSRQDALSGPASPGPQYRARTVALAAVLQRADHPERVGPILLRGPPASSA